MEIVVILALVLLNGIFSMTEMSLVSAKKFKLENLKKKGNSGAKAALELSENPTKFLSTIQIGITLIGILLGVYSGENLSKDLTNFISSTGFLTDYADKIATAVLVIFITYLSIVLGELMPKRIGMAYPEAIAVFFSKPMQFISLITSPFVWMLTSTNNLVLGLLGIKNDTDQKVSEEEIKSIIKESAEGGEIQDIEQTIVERVFELGDRKVNTLFTHRNDIVFFQIHDTWESLVQTINQEKHSAYPVSSSADLDDILGIVQLKDLFIAQQQADFSLQSFIKKPIFLNENASAYNALELFKKEKTHVGIVINEYGTTIGMLTMNDVMDALVGEIKENEHQEYQIVPRNDHSWLVDGQYSIFEFVKYFQLYLPEINDNHYATVAGLIIHQFGRLPEVGETILIEDYKLEVIDKDGQRIDKVMVTKINQENR
jgi:putative hemolysin